MERRKEYMTSVKRVVIKVGSSTLTHPNGLLNLSCIDGLVKQLSDLHNSGLDVILVSSGAIAAGMGRLGLKSKPKSIPQKQACAAIGQVTLMHMYDKFFGEYGKITAQILITKEDMEHKDRLINARNTFMTIIEDKAIPIVNENDAITTEEIKIGDNDTLSAHVCRFVEGDLLIIMTDIEGLYDSNPNENPDAKLIGYVEKVTDDIEALAGGAGSNLGTGGMKTKLSAAKIVNDAGAAMVIAHGSTPNILNNILSGENIGTFFDCK
ncbi:glutamate 5-kinase [Clostridium oryzae]|uniref:Glutamate 5-kinase n=1 Tax=Clostridium oryzae TaxID=1450648 RepID=A0A1V4IMG9_9CLOT|nr:glutamate 5-kinase [Clostridium oryzae]OPJ61211.1 glutamate 5-kinase [Clostridium oryzae]